MTVPETSALMGQGDVKALMETILGRHKADLAIINGRLANVYTGELLDNTTITVKGKWIASVGQDAEEIVGDETTVIDAAEMTIVPGFIDGHTHLAPCYDAAEFSHYALKGGTTTVIAETMEAFPVGGYEGILDYVNSYRDQPLKLFGTVPSMVSISKTCSGIPAEVLNKLLGRHDIVGLGESYWQAVLQDPDQFLPLFEETLRCRKRVEGHSAGASGKKLMAYIASGVSSCHEPISAEEVVERLRLGIYVMIREGSIRRELNAVSRIKNMGVDLRRLILVSDGLDPKDIMEMGHMDFVVQKAIDCGFESMDAVRMATLNVAEHFSLDGILGGIAPGKYADILIIPNMHVMKPEYVISNGNIVVRKGDVLAALPKPVYSRESLSSIHLPQELKPEDFIIPTSGEAPFLKVRVIDQITDLVTAELIIDVPICDGHIPVDLERDIIKVAAIDRTHSPGRRFVGLLRGFHMKSGAFATSAAWDTSDIVVVGASDQDMAQAVNRIRFLRGGTVVCDGGEILAEFPLPVYGLISELPMAALAEKMDAITAAAHRLGIPFVNPFITLATLTGAAIPYLRICEEGLVNLKDGKTRGLFVEEKY